MAEDALQRRVDGLEARHEHLEVLVAPLGTDVTVSDPIIYDGDSAADLVFLIGSVVVLLLFPVPKLVWWLTSHFVVTSDRVIHREGFIAKRSMEIPLEAINDVRFDQGIIDRMLGAGRAMRDEARVGEGARPARFE